MARRPVIAIGFEAVAVAMKAKCAQQTDAAVVDLLIKLGRAGAEIPDELRDAILDFGETYRRGPIQAGEILHARILALLPTAPPPPPFAWQTRRDLQ